jgi:uncharacterized protein YggE
MKTLIAGVLMMLVASAAVADDKSIFDQPHISVTGTGEVNAKPDMATITIGVMTEAESAAQALEQNNGRMQKLFERLKGLGIAEKDIQTANFNVSPKYENNPQRAEAPRIVGYTVTNEVRIRVRRLSSLGRVLDQAVQDGANRIHGISFSIDDDTNVMDEARKKAMSDARRKAELLAEAAGVRLGKPLSITDQPQARPMPMPMMQMRMMAADSVPVAPGELTNTATIQVTYSLMAEDKSDK